MSSDFSKDYWEKHWGAGQNGVEPPAAASMPANPYVAEQTANLTPGTALDVGCGTGTESLWLAEHGWQVTGIDISATALATAKDRTTSGPTPEWIEADASTWQPGREWDLVMTNYAHAAGGQLDLYRRISSWVAPGGTLLIVGHRHGQHDHHPEHATVTADQITAQFAEPDWRVDAAYDNTRTVRPGHQSVTLHDVIVRLTRSGAPHAT